ncbi:hypothetical protein [Streptomyces sp. NPDC006552]|uniref:hypothetical protein n=1 Tax=Streptomyces sp. NPDC006552 TaxID=3157179 RepID=UPI0033A8712E
MAEKRRRLRSSTVVLGSMGVLAAALTSCSSDPDRRCVDRDSYESANGYKIVSDQYCKNGSGKSSTGKGRKSGAGTGGSASGTSKSGRVDGAWYYDADVSGRRADDGTFSRSEAVDRGGFGCSGSGSGGG